MSRRENGQALKVGIRVQQELPRHDEIKSLNLHCDDAASYLLAGTDVDTILSVQSRDWPPWRKELEGWSL